MVHASLRGVSLSEAEQAIACVWCRIEEYGIDAPRLRFGFRRDGSVTVRFSFADPSSAYLALSGLDAGLPEMLGRTAALAAKGRRTGQEMAARNAALRPSRGRSV